MLADTLFLTRRSVLDVGVIAAVTTLTLAACATSTPRPAPTDTPTPAADGGWVVRVNDIDVYFTEAGSGPPILLMHSGGGSQEEFASLRTYLAEQFRVITPDTRGQGRTSDTGGELSYALFADDAAAFIEVLGLEKPIVGGLSDGGCAALHLAIQHPEVASGLILMSTMWNRSNYYAENLAGSATATPSPEDPQATNYPDFATYSDYFRRLVNEMWATQPTLELSDVKGITVPVHVMYGERDVLMPRQPSQDLAEALPNGSFEVIPLGRHLMTIEAPDLVNAAVREFALSITG